jgi:hypothetical protein
MNKASFRRGIKRIGEIPSSELAASVRGMLTKLWHIATIIACLSIFVQVLCLVYTQQAADVEEEVTGFVTDFALCLDQIVAAVLICQQALAFQLVCTATVAALPADDLVLLGYAVNLNRVSEAVS